MVAHCEPILTHMDTAASIADDDLRVSTTITTVSALLYSEYHSRQAFSVEIEATYPSGLPQLVSTMAMYSDASTMSRWN